jgi:hypothetical protein
VASSSHRGRLDPRDDRGAVIVIFAASMGLLLVLVALVLDISGAQRDKNADQAAADAMALAAAAELGNSSQPGVAACQAAWEYLVVNLPTIEVRPAASCTAFASVCSPSSARSATAVVSEYRITITHPVPAGHDLLAGQTATANDGTPCQRVGIRVEQSRDNLFAEGAVGLDVHAVGRHIPGVGDATAPLILLSEHGCGVLRITGTGAVSVDTATGEPGYIAIDSDGSECSNPNRVILDVNGQGTVAADQVYMWALADGDATSAYSAGLISPMPVAASAPVGRSAMDWRYNCSVANGCPGTPTAHLDTLVTQWAGSGEPLPLGSFTRWTTSGRSCSPTGDVVVPAGSWWIDCGTSGLSVGGTLTFQGGDIVSDGPIKATGTGGVRVNCSDGNPNDLVAPSTCPADPPSPSILVLRSGDLMDAGGIELRETMVYMQAGTAKLSGQHSVVWTAPDDPTFRFDDLALWTESTSQMTLTGGSNLYVEGILFAPNTTLEVAGNTGTEGMKAQIWAKATDLVGGAQLRLVPEHDRITTVGRGKQLLVR